MRDTVKHSVNCCIAAAPVDVDDAVMAWKSVQVEYDDVSESEAE